MTKIFDFTVHDVDVDNHCDRDNNQDHTIIVDDEFDTTIIDNEFYTTSSTTVVEPHTTCTTTDFGTHHYQNLHHGHH